MNESYTFKDKNRIEDIITKSIGHPEKEIQLAQRMCNLIKDSAKAMARAEAAKDLGKFELAKIFLERAKELGIGNSNTGELYYNLLKYDLDDYFKTKKREEDFNTHINTESELDKDGIFYNVGIPTLYDQNDNKNIKLFRYALIRITQHLANQQHVWVMPMSYDKEKGVLIVRVSPNFTHPKYKVDAASREYPKLLANHLNKLYGEGTVISSRSQISFMKDIDFKKLVTSVAYADKKTGNI
jgi:tetratricopeptide (TPR) repeat protein